MTPNSATSTITLTFPDGTKREFPSGTTAYEVAKAIGQRLADAAIAAKLDSDLIDLNFKIEKDGKFAIFTFDSKEGKEIFWHSSAHLLAHAVVELFPEAKLTIGPAVENGFYYDIEHVPFTPSDINKIEDRMHQIVKQNVPLTRIEMTKSEAKKMFKDNPYKLEMIDEMEGVISAYTQGAFVDMCRGPHVPNTGKIKSLKLTKTAGAYWRGDEKNKQLQRIYGVSYPDKKLLAEYLTQIEEAEKRDNRKIGKELDLFMFHEYAPGMPFFLPKGMTMMMELLKFVRELSYGEGYKEVRTPHIFNSELWKVSGHWANYKDDMFCMHHAEDNMDLGVKPMNCPAHHLIYKRDSHSYKDLPLRIAETTTLYRNERSGTLMGLTRVRSLSQDDTHIFLAENQILDEITTLLGKVKTIYHLFGLKIDEIHLSTRPEKFLGKKETWDYAEENLKKALERSGLKYQINEGDGAFYGPKIDVKVKDAIGRQWQLATIQLDYQLPQRFELTYDDADGSKKVPVVVHRAILGSMERFLGVLIEHYAGKFPLWLSPVQVSVLTVADRHNDYAEKIVASLKKKGIRAEADIRSESIPKKVRDNQLKQINYILVVGDKEQENNTINVRTRDNVVHGEKKIDVFAAELLKEIGERR